jgi:hypothetical protein
MKLHILPTSSCVEIHKHQGFDLKYDFISSLCINVLMKWPNTYDAEIQMRSHTLDLMKYSNCSWQYVYAATTEIRNWLSGPWLALSLT